MYSGGPEFWNRRKHTIRKPPTIQMKESARALLPDASHIRFLEDGDSLRLHLTQRLMRKDQHAWGLGKAGVEFTGRNHLMRAFNRAHRGPGTDVDIVEFKRAMEQFAVKASDRACEELFNRYDHDNNGKINYCEFVARMNFKDVEDLDAAMLRLQDFEQRNPGIIAERLEQASDGGLISPVELRKILTTLDLRMAEWDLERMLQESEHVQGMILYEDFLEKFVYPQESVDQSLTITHRASSSRIKLSKNLRGMSSRTLQKKIEDTSLNMGLEVRPPTSAGRGGSSRGLPPHSPLVATPSFSRPSTAATGLSVISGLTPRAPSAGGRSPGGRSPRAALAAASHGQAVPAAPAPQPPAANQWEPAASQLRPASAVAASSRGGSSAGGGGRWRRFPGAAGGRSGTASPGAASSSRLNLNLALQAPDRAANYSRMRSARSWASAPCADAAELYKVLLRAFLAQDPHRTGRLRMQQLRCLVVQHRATAVLPMEDLNEILTTKPNVEDSGVVNYMTFLKYFKEAVKKREGAWPAGGLAPAPTM